MVVTERPGLARLLGLGSMLLLGVLYTAGYELKAATSRDGSRWIWGGTWTLPAGQTPRIGLISLGKQDPNDPSATARFDYFRVYQP